MPALQRSTTPAHWRSRPTQALKLCTSQQGATRSRCRPRSRRMRSRQAAEVSSPTHRPGDAETFPNSTKYPESIPSPRAAAGKEAPIPLDPRVVLEFSTILRSQRFGF